MFKGWAPEANLSLAPQIRFIYLLIEKVLIKDKKEGVSPLSEVSGLRSKKQQQRLVLS